jgi:hypothetical protein
MLGWFRRGRSSEEEASASAGEWMKDGDEAAQSGPTTGPAALSDHEEASEAAKQASFPNKENTEPQNTPALRRVMDALHPNAVLKSISPTAVRLHAPLQPGSRHSGY